MKYPWSLPFLAIFFVASFSVAATEAAIEPSIAVDSVDEPIKTPVVTTTNAPHDAPTDATLGAPTDATLGAPTDATLGAPTDATLGAPTEIEPITAKPQRLKIPSTVTTAPETHEKTLPSPVHIVDGVSAEQSLKWLANGNTRYVRKKFRADGRSEKERAKIAKEQKPHAIVLSCSDSRVPPELIFDQGLGEITTIRVTGEVLDASIIASIEQALLREHPHLLIVLGHTRCDAIQAVLGWKEKTTEGSDALDRMIAEIKPHLKTVSTQPPSPELQIESALQADGVARDLPDRSEIIKHAVTSGELTIKTALYWVDSGLVKFY